MLRSPFLGLLCCFFSLRAGSVPARSWSAAVSQDASSARLDLNWHSPTRLAHALTKSRGTLTIDAQRVQFLPQKGSPLRWSFTDIQSFHLTQHRLTLLSYANRSWHLPGARKFRFDLTTPLPPDIAAALARSVGKPVRNGNPAPDAPAFATLPARHPTRGGGTNGVLRFREGGIDYVTPSGRGARSWRWSDIQTLAHPDPYHFRVSAYREIFRFDLKQPMSPDLFDRLWDHVYARDLSGLHTKRGVRP